jgi:hypothetical protein
MHHPSKLGCNKNHDQHMFHPNRLFKSLDNVSLADKQAASRKLRKARARIPDPILMGIRTCKQGRCTSIHHLKNVMYLNDRSNTIALRTMHLFSRGESTSKQGHLVLASRHFEHVSEVELERVLSARPTKSSINVNEG